LRLFVRGLLIRAVLPLGSATDMRANFPNSLQSYPQVAMRFPYTPAPSA
jgi:hypothetical protein